MTMKNKIPKRRFKGFTDDWEQRKFPEFVQFYNGQTYKPEDVQDDGVLVLRSSNVKNDEIVEADNIYLDKSVANAEQVRKGDIIVVVRNGSRALIGKHAEIKREMPNTVIGAFMTGIRSEHSSFVNALLGTPQFEREIEMNMGATINQITGYMFSKMAFMIPSGDEQDKIGAYFKGLDDLIALHQRKSEKLMALKKAYLSEMFPRPGEKYPQRRFKGFTDAWEQRKLGDIVSFSKGSGYSKADLQNTGTPIILYGRLYTKYETVISEVDTFADEKPNSVFSKGGEVIVPASGETAEDISVAAVVDQSGVMLGGDLNIITPPRELDSTFLAISISNGKPHSDMAKMAQGKSVVHLHNSDLAKIDLPYPSYEEQRQISQHFKTLDNLIALHQRKLAKLQALKKAYLTEMFP